MPITSLALGVIFAGVGLTSASATSDEYTHQINQWHAERVERLKKPDGWLSLIGLAWLEQGPNTVGSATDNDLVLAKGPAHLGVVDWADDGTVRLTLNPDAAALINGEDKNSAVLLDDSHDDRTTISFDGASFYLISRGAKKGLRVKDPESPIRTGFTEIDRFPVDPSWRIEAKWIPFDPVHQLKVPTVTGTVENYPVPGKLVFERDGKTFELLPVIEVPGDTELFVIFADRTSGKETYAAARFLYMGMPSDGKAVIDFNKAYNPPCAFTPHATCPLAPPENRLDLRVTAGEKKYTGPGAHEG